MLISSIFLSFQLNVSLVNAKKGLKSDTTLRVTVVAKSKPTIYTNQTGEERQCLNVAIADTDTVGLCRVYDSTSFNRFQVGNSVCLRNMILRDNPFVVT